MTSRAQQLIERYSGAEKERGLWYHGTSARLLRPILAEGLVPNPKKRSWDTDTPSAVSVSRASYGGIYVSRNFMSAYSAGNRTARKDGARTLMVLLSLQPRTLVADEDDFAGRLKDIQPHLSGHTISSLHRYQQLLHPNDRPEAEEERQDWARKNTDYLLRSYQGRHPELHARVEALLYGQGWPAMITRNASHHDMRDYSSRWDWWRLWPREMQEEPETIPALPSPQEGERLYRQFIDQLTRTLKSYPRKEDTFSRTARLLQPVGFSGANRIIALVELHHEHPDYGMVVHYGSLPETFLADYRTSITSQFWIQQDPQAAHALQ